MAQPPPTGPVGRRRRRAVTGRGTSACALALVLAASAGGLPSAAATATPPQTTVDPASAGVGQPLVVTLTGWPTGNVQLEICGNQARRGSVDCAAGAARQLYVPGPQPATGRLTLAAPPVACPCVIRSRLLDPGTPDSAAAAPVTSTVAIDITGLTAPVAPATTVPAQLRLENVTVAPADRDWSTLFALRGAVVLDVDVRNDGPSDINAPRLSLLTGRPEQATVIADAPEIAPLPAGQRRTLRIVVPLDGPLYGRYVVHGQFQVGVPGTAAAPGAAFVAEAEHYPWGWAAVAGGLILILLVRQFVGLARARRLSS
ncbi:hypothetical protein [Micromonospora sp. LOL_023]|uniref:hypothetical protein n=1 Tax=Micromonospora sp. LOL_023 TaxID=3345418 RepID=UPI003A8704C4